MTVPLDLSPEGPIMGVRQSGPRASLAMPVAVGSMGTALLWGRFSDLHSQLEH